MKISKLNLLYLILLITSISCKSEYSKVVEKELQSGLILDSTIFDLTFGDSKETYFKKCYELNKQKIITNNHGPNPQYIEKLDSTMDQTLTKELLFKGIFDEAKILRGVELNYSYTSWAPWNKKRQSSFLLEDLKNKFRKEYGGNDFIEIKIDHNKVKAFVKIDGNRQILMYEKGDDSHVIVKMEDLRYKIKK